MRTTLRRSCNACAKAKHSCDLRTPRCSRCIKRRVSCVYANEPLTLQAPEGPGHGRTMINKASKVTCIAQRDVKMSRKGQDGSVKLLNSVDTSFDPFGSYPPTRLSRIHVQRLIHHFLSNIAFQYYPLDLSMISNPFIVSWWPLALADPALFHVSIQTACLDEELRAHKGFPISELLMVDSVSLIRQKIENSSLAFQDDTLNSVVTLAAIEHGKGNVEASRTHIDGVKRIVGVRGGISHVRQSSPLTARMVAWVSMLVTGAPQFPIQDDLGIGDGVCPTLQWLLASPGFESPSEVIDDLDIDPAVIDILTRLRSISQEASSLSGTELHDLTCFVVHKLLLLPPLSTQNLQQSAASESLRYALALYMLAIHGTTYYSHIGLVMTIMQQFRSYLEILVGSDVDESLKLWIFSVGMVSSIDPINSKWFTEQAYLAATSLKIQTWEHVLVHFKRVLWMETPRGVIFQQRWKGMLT